MVQIRSAILEDCLGIAHVQVDSYRAAYAGLFPAPYLEHFTYADEEQDWIQLLTSGAQDILLVAMSPDQEVVGYVLAKVKANIFPGYDAEIVAIHVKQSYQGKGIGELLLRNAIRTLFARDCRSVMLWTLKNNPIRQWYEKLNGELVGEKNYEVDDWIITEVAYGWKDLSALL